ncbi:MAG: N-acetylmuramoyl-L-alanine amidase [Sedimentisphaerales bacterium]|nr:N-acetylmuramoyl-L-alanine amidase [Sedimentisphaerales bacterium]
MTQRQIRAVVGWVTTCLVSLSGCIQPESVDLPVVYPAEPVVRINRIPVDQLAQRLGLEAAELQAGYVALQDGDNYVLLSTLSEGKAYVNGRMVGYSRALVLNGGVVLVAGDLEGQIRPLLRHTPAAAAAAASGPLIRPGSGSVMIDPGHGGRDPGAIGVNGYQEKHVNLSVAQRVAEELSSRGYTVRLTRDRDEFIELDERVELANRLGPGLFVSIHADSTANQQAQGFSVYLARAASAAAERAARLIEQAFQEAQIAGRGRRRADFRVLQGTRCPAVLVELGYLSNRQEADRLADTAYQRVLAQVVAAAISEFFQ